MLTLSSLLQLENLELINIRTLAGLASSPCWIYFPRLRNYTLASLLPETLNFFLSSISLPKQGTIRITHTSHLHANAPDFHDHNFGMSTALDPICITSVILHATDIEYLDSSNPDRATLSIKVIDFAQVLQSPGYSPDLSRVAVLEVYDMNRLFLRPTGDIDFVVVRNTVNHIRTLVIHRQALTTLPNCAGDNWLSPFNEAVNLQTLFLHDMNLIISRDFGAACVRVITAFITSLTPKTSVKVLLRGCDIDAAGLNALEAIVEVDISDSHVREN
jgi:hypothetical protein